MNEYDDLRALLQQAVPPIQPPIQPPVQDRSPTPDLWPEVLAHRSPPPSWTWLDLGAAAAIAILLSLFPDCLWLLLYHL